LENGLGHAEGNVRPHVEQGPTEFLDGDRIHVAAHGQRGEPAAPGLVVGADGFE
jgi:hypothetical protein